MSAARALGLGLLLAAAPAAAAGRPELRQTASLAHHSACGRSPGGPLAYGWPVRPFRRQHPIRGNFGDPRTLAEVGGTYQNFPVFGTHYFFRHAGRYRFQLTPVPLETRALHDGSYVLTVAASDVCGNRGTASEAIRIRN